MLGVPAADIPSAEDGRPIWPSGFTGSITHSASVTFSAAASEVKVISLGIDTEDRMPSETAAQIIPLITEASEYRRLGRTAHAPEMLATIIFSAKEAIFKCLYPVVKFQFDFIDVELTSIDLALGSFSFSIGRKLSYYLGLRPLLEGKLALIDGRIHTGVLLPRE